MSLFVLNVFHHGELYEVFVRGTILSRILRYRPEQQIGTEIEWDDLEDEVRAKIIQKFQDKET